MEIREAKETDASAIGHLYEQSAAYLRALGDETDFKCKAQIFCRCGSGSNDPLNILNGNLILFATN
jgi:hypothetical protein